MKPSVESPHKQNATTAIDRLRLEAMNVLARCVYGELNTHTSGERAQRTSEHSVHCIMNDQIIERGHADCIDNVYTI